MKISLPRLSVLLVLPLLALLTLVGLVGCEEPGVEERAVPEGVEAIDRPQDAAPPAPPAPSAPSEPTQPAEAPDAAAGSWPWTAPDGWRFIDESRPMRLATYAVETDQGVVEVAISRFPGDVGGMLANVNRWRGQVGLEPVGQGELDGMMGGAMQRFENPGFVGHTMRLDGPEGHMLVASIHESDEDRTWFVRVTTDAQAADAVQDDVFAFARSFGAGS